VSQHSRRYEGESDEKGRYGEGDSQRTKEKTNEVERPEHRNRLLPERGSGTIGGTGDDVNLALSGLRLAHSDAEGEHDGNGENGYEDGEHACVGEGREKERGMKEE
jgi:hypothetical protein